MAEDDLTPEEVLQVAQLERGMARSLIRQWKLNRSLYRKYGGRIIGQQLGPEPLDAYRDYLEQRHAAGDFSIRDKAFAEAFWGYFRDDSRHDFYPPGSAETAQVFSIPPWVDQSGSAPGAPGVSAATGAPLAPEHGGPLNWQVSGVTRGLNLRASTSTSADILGSYPAGTVLDNLGCRQVDGRSWCDVQRLGGGARGYVVADYLVPAVAPHGAVVYGPDNSALRAGRGDFDATGSLPCAWAKGQPMSECNFGVARTGGGYATVVVSRPDGRQRAIFFRMGIPIGADTSQADGYPLFSADKEGDLHSIRVGEERYEIPDAAILGG
jgi:hypothetical protein